MRFKRASAVALLTAFVPAPVAAQTPIRADSGKTFKHRPSGIVVAAAAAGIPRVSVVEYDDKQLDVAADFRTPDQSEITTVFIFRKVTGDVPLWFDRIEHVVAAKPELASPTLSIPPTAFTPLGQPNSRGLIAVFTAGRGPWKSSAAALTTIGDWFVAVRASSQTLPAEQLLGRLEQTFSALSWREKVMAPVAVPVRACPTALPQPAEDAAPVEDDGPGLLLNALIPAVPASSPDEESAVHRWCRDPLNLPDAGVYRPEEALDRYLVAFQDSGRGVWVAPNTIAALVNQEAGKDGALNYIVELVQIDRHAGFGNFARLPSVAQALWLAQHGTRKYSTTTWGKDTKVEIDPNAMK